jgi:hypothetical protein
MNAQVVDGTTVNTAAGATLIPDNATIATALQAVADAQTGIAGASVAQYLSQNNATRIAATTQLGGTNTSITTRQYSERMDSQP